jgi:hypothetical protein
MRLQMVLGSVARRIVCVALSTANPRTHWTISYPMYGIADSRFVVTVAQHICAYGCTYSMNAVAMVENRLKIFTDRVCVCVCV